MSCHHIHQVPFSGVASSHTSGGSKAVSGRLVCITPRLECCLGGGKQAHIELRLRLRSVLSSTLLVLLRSDMYQVLTQTPQTSTSLLQCLSTSACSKVQATKLANTAWLAGCGHAVHAEVCVHVEFQLTWPHKLGLQCQVQSQSSLQMQHAYRHTHSSTLTNVSNKIMPAVALNSSHTLQSCDTILCLH